GANRSRAKSTNFDPAINCAKDFEQVFPVAGRWLQVTGPVGNVETIAIVGDRVLTASAPGINISTDNGASWQPAYNTNLTKYADSFVLIGTKLFAGTPLALVASTDNGASWAGVNYDPASPIPTRSLAVIGAQLFAIRKNQLVVSSDQGMNWSKLSSPPGGSPG